MPEGTSSPEEENQKYVVNCPTDGVQIATDVNAWPKEIAEIMGKETYVTGNCPRCHSTLSVTLQSIPQTKEEKIA